MNIDELERAYETAAATTSYATHQEFIARLLSSNDPAMIAYHYELLRRRDNHAFHQRIRHAFTQRKQAAERFLAGKLDVEKDPKVLADVLLLLGTMRSPAAADAARRLSTHPDHDVRYNACVVLGWTGEPLDIPILSRAVLADAQPLIRGTAATALRQLWHRLPDTKETSLEALGKAIGEEPDEEALRLMIVAAQSIAGKKFGLTEKIEERRIVGDVERARQKALSALEPL